mgnify:FL=1
MSNEVGTVAYENVRAERAEQRVTELEAALGALIKHWRAGEPCHEMEGLMDRAEIVLRH